MNNKEDGKTARQITRLIFGNDKIHNILNFRTQLRIYNRSADIPIYSDKGIYHKVLTLDFCRRVISRMNKTSSGLDKTILRMQKHELEIPKYQKVLTEYGIKIHREEENQEES